MEQYVVKNTDQNNEPRKTTWWFIAIVSVLTLINVLVYQCHKADNETTITTDTVYQSDTVMETDTFCLYTPIPQYQVLERWDTLLLPQPTDTVPLPIIRSQYSDTVTKDNGATVEYYASISGYNAALDTIDFTVTYPQITNTEYVTTTIEKIKPAPRFSLGPSIGIGYGITSKQFDAYAGVSLTYRF